MGQILDGSMARKAHCNMGFRGSQWIATEAKDGFNSIGVGAFFNALNTGQAILLHVALLPLLLGGIVIWHIILIRRKGVVPPIDNDATLEGGK
jgi:quinol-cytochrome oxidoreductase complex cytochrome b subunit